MSIFLNHNNADVAALTEHWLNNERILTTKIDGYILASCYARTYKMHGGSCIFVKHGVSCIELTQLKQKSVELVLECSSIEITEHKLIIINIYRSPRGDLQHFFAILEEILDIVIKTRKTYNLVLTGDFNINLQDEYKASVRRIKDILNTYNLTDTIKEPTRITRNSATTIDNIFTNIKSFESEVIVSALSDHLSQRISFTTRAPTTDRIERTVKHAFSKDNLLHFRERLNVDWSQILLSDNDVDTSYDMFNEYIQEQVRETCPLRTTKRTNRKLDNYWITAEIKAKCIRKRWLYEDTLNGRIKNEEYRAYSRKLKVDIQAAKSKYNTEYIQKAPNKVKATWDIVKNITGSRNEHKFYLEDIWNNISQGKTECLSHINQYLIKICENLNDNGDVRTNSVKYVNKTIFLYPTNPVEVLNTISSLKDIDSVGHDGIPVKLIKHCAVELAQTLCVLINKTFETGIFPEQLKKTTVSLIHKKGKKSDIGNYRPIAILSNISKIFEKIIYQRIYDFLEEHNILSTAQNAYIKGRTTTRAIFQVIKNILNGINTDRETMGLFMDLSKAFDRVNHKKLYKKLILMGIRGVALELLTSYLTNRQQRVVAYQRNGTKMFSGWERSERGVPQGSILGPLLFLLYINDLPEIVGEDTTLFADDSSAIIKASKKTNMDGTVSVMLKKFDEWFLNNDLQLNITKTVCIQFGYYKSEELIINYNNSTLTTQNETKFLGVMIDSQLNWKSHINYLASKISSFNYALRIISQSVTIKASLCAYFAYVQSWLRYGVIFWGNSVEAKRIFILQKYCLRSVFNLNRTDSCRNIFLNNKILTLPGLYVLECAGFVRDNYELYKDNLLDHCYKTRGIGKSYIQLPQTTRSMISKSVMTLTINIYNYLPVELKCLSAIKFKTELRRVLANNVLYCVEDFFRIKFDD